MGSKWNVPFASHSLGFQTFQMFPNTDQKQEVYYTTLFSSVIRNKWKVATKILGRNWKWIESLDFNYPGGKHGVSKRNVPFTYFCEVKSRLHKNFTKVSKNDVDEIIGILCTYYPSVSLSLSVSLSIFLLIFFAYVFTHFFL